MIELAELIPLLIPELFTRPSINSGEEPTFIFTAGDFERNNLGRRGDNLEVYHIGSPEGPDPTFKAICFNSKDTVKADFIPHYICYLPTNFSL